MEQVPMPSRKRSKKWMSVHRNSVKPSNIKFYDDWSNKEMISEKDRKKDQKGFSSKRDSL